MADTLRTGEILSDEQLIEAQESLAMMTHFNYGTVITSRTAAQSLFIQSLIELDGVGEMSFKGETLDFDDPDSINSFLDFWGKKKRLLDHLHEGSLNPSDLVQKGYKEYPIFLFVNPIDVGGFDEYGLGSVSKSERANKVLKKFCKWGRFHVVVTPDRFENTGTNWPKVAEAYQQAIQHPRGIENKLELGRYLIKRNGIQKLGLEERVEDPYTIFTPRAEAIQRIVSS